MTLPASGLNNRPMSIDSGRPAPLPRALLVGWALFGLANAVAIALFARPPATPLGATTRLVVHLYDFGQALAAGCAFALPALLWTRFAGARRRLGWVLLLVLAPLAAYPLVSEDLLGPANRLASRGPASMWLWLLVTALAWAVVASARITRGFARPRWRWVAVTGGLLGAPLNLFLLQRDYPGAHLLVAVWSATTAGTALLGVRWPLGRITTWSLAGLAAVAGIAAVVVPPPNAVQARLLDIEGAALAPFVWRSDDTAGGEAAPQGLDSEWFRPRSQAKAVPASKPALVQPDSVILFYSVDSLRYDALSPANREFIPELLKLRDEALSFDEARTPGSQTIYSLTELFAGTYFSQQYWSPAVTEGYTATWPHADPSVRFTEVLAKGGVPTVHYGQAEWFLNRYGMTSGFSEERWINPAPGKRWSEMPVVVDAMIERLERHKGGPLFLFVHSLDAHAPYERVAKTGTAKQQYQRALRLVDDQFGRLRRALVDTGLEARTIIVVSADHGEGFGEHGTSYHGQNLYDEQVRVPLFVRVPGVAPRRVSTPVTLMDVGPTLLDLMGLDTPAQSMGQSLVPFLRGETPVLTRPIIAEGRLKQSMVLPDGHKLIFDQRTGTKEIYDLHRDPGELRNLYDEMGAQGDAKIAILRAFFSVHKIRKRGYKIPFRR